MSDFARVRFGLEGHRRQGSAGVFVVLILALVVVTFSATLVRRMADERRTEFDRQRITVLESAIDAIEMVDADGAKKFEMPIDKSIALSVVVEILESDDDSARYHATIYKDGKPGFSIFRKTRKSS